MIMTQTQREIAYLRHHLYAHTKPNGGILFFDALQKCRLDGSPQSIDRLDNLLEQMRQKGVTPDAIRERQVGKNFLLTLAIYIVDCIGAKIDDVPIWQNRDEAIDSIPEVPPKQFAFSAMAQFSYGASLPLGPIESALTDGYSIKDYISSTVNNILEKSRVDLNVEPNTVCKRYLKKVRTGTLIDTTVGYHKQLSKINFDYSQKSLAHIDKFLAWLKRECQKENLDYTQFLSQGSNQAMVFLLGYYIGMCSCALAKTQAKWFAYQQIVDMGIYDDIEQAFENFHILMFENGMLRLPFLAITNYLFDIAPETYHGAQAFASAVKKEHMGDMVSYSLYGNEGVKEGVEEDVDANLTRATQSESMPADWVTAAELAGMLAAWNMVHVSGGSEALPMSIKQEGESISFVSHVLEDADGLDRLINGLNMPQMNSKFNFLSYDMYLNLPTGRTDGILIEIRVFDKTIQADADGSLTFDGSESVSIQLAVPYRNANDSLGFAIFPVVRRRSSSQIFNEIPEKWLEEFASHFYQGAKKITNPERLVDFWTTYYIDTLDVFEPSNLIKDAVNVPFDESNSNIVLFSSEEVEPPEPDDELQLNGIGLSLGGVTNTNSDTYRDTNNQNQHDLSDLTPQTSQQPKETAEAQPMPNTAQQNQYYKELLQKDKEAVLSKLQNAEKERKSNNLTFYMIGFIFAMLIIQWFFW